METEYRNSDLSFAVGKCAFLPCAGVRFSIWAAKSDLLCRLDKSLIVRDKKNVETKPYFIVKSNAVRKKRRTFAERYFVGRLCADLTARRPIVSLEIADKE